MFVFLENITYRYRGAQMPVLDGLSLFVRSGEIVAIVGEAGAGKTTLLRYVGKRSDRQGGVHIGSDGYASETEPTVIRGWRFSGGVDAYPPESADGTMARRMSTIPRFAIPSHGAGKIPPFEPPGGMSAVISRAPICSCSKQHRIVVYTRVRFRDIQHGVSV